MTSDKILFKENLNSIERNDLASSSDKENAKKDLQSLDELIRSDPLIRASIEENFYAVLASKMNILLEKANSVDDDDADVWLALSLIQKCVKNSAAAYRNELTTTENKLCLWLLDYLNSNLNNSIFFGQHRPPASLVSKFNFHLFLFQYIFNLTQGSNLFCIIFYFPSIKLIYFISFYYRFIFFILLLLKRKKPQ
jgi:hypothetical protein